jgi:adenylate cyclase
MGRSGPSDVVVASRSRACARHSVRRVGCVRDDPLEMESGEQESVEQLAGMLRRFGVSEPAIARAIELGESEAGIAEIIPARGAASRTVSAAQIEASGGMPVERIGELMEAFGIPLLVAEDPAFTPDEARVLEQLWRLRDVWPLELSVQLGRIYGRLLARIANASVQLWTSVVEPRLQAADLDDRLRLLAAAETFDALLPVADTLLIGIHRRWVEREASQIAIRGAEREAGEEALPDAVEVSILFCDLKDFTAFADRHGDSAAVRIIDQFARVVTREHGPEARLTKWLGDGFMLVYPIPGLAVAAGVRIIDGMRAPDRPGVHASVHHGHAIPREGDYFGSVVNLTARLLGEAGHDELVATRAVAERCPDVTWQPGGTHRLRGVDAPVEMFKLVSVGARAGSQTL